MAVNDIFAITESIDSVEGEQKIKMLCESIDVMKRDLLIYFEKIEERLLYLENK